MSDKHIMTFEVDRTQLFDAVYTVGDGGKAISERLLGSMFGDDSVATTIGLGFYGVALMTDEAPQASGEGTD